MAQTDATKNPASDLFRSLTSGAIEEARALGIYEPEESRNKDREGIDPVEGRTLIPRRAITAPEVLNEAFQYHPRASSFSRGLRVELPGASLLLLSGTASVDENGATVHPGDFEAQCLRTYRNLTHLLVAEGASWHDIVRTTCYLRDIERDYDTFNDLRTMFMTSIGLDPLPASTGIQARLCRSDLLIEVEAMAVVPNRE